MERLTADPSDVILKQLRSHNDVAPYIEEPDCRWAEAKALGAIAAPSNDDPLDEIPSLPKELGDYELIEPIASGGMGTVYKAHHQRLRRDVAVKIISSRRVTDLRAMQRFEGEIRTLGRLCHPNIVSALDAREVDGRPVLIMEYVDGLDLSQIVTKLGALEPADVAAIGKAVADALEYANANGLIHRDVKPSNIMINVQGEVKLLDLGLARLRLSDNSHPEWTGTGLVLGTADYMSPEQINDSRQVDIRSDLYSLGCTLYKLLTGHAPYSGKKYHSNFSKLAAHASIDPIRFSKEFAHIPESLRTIVERLLQKSPDNRPATALEIAKLLEPFAKNADLKKAVIIARNVPLLRISSSDAVTADEPNKSLRATTFFDRFNPWLLAIACLAFFPIGIALGTIISIKQKNGKTTKIEVPDGATVQILEDGSITADIKPSGAKNKNAPNSQLGDATGMIYSQGPGPSAGMGSSMTSEVALGPPVGQPYITPELPQASSQLNGPESTQMLLPNRLPAGNPLAGSGSLGSEGSGAMSSNQLPLRDNPTLPSGDSSNVQPFGEPIELLGVAEPQQQSPAQQVTPAPKTALKDRDIASAMTAINNSTIPTYRGYSFEKWLNLLQTERSNDLIVEAGRAIITLSDSPERTTTATSEILKRCRSIGGSTIDDSPRAAISQRWMSMLMDDFKSLDIHTVMPLLIKELREGNEKSRRAVVLLLQANEFTEFYGGKAVAVKLETDLPKQLIEALALAAESMPQEANSFQTKALGLAVDYNVEWDALPSRLQEFSEKAWSNALQNGQRPGPYTDVLQNVVSPTLWLPYWHTVLDAQKQNPSFVIESIFYDTGIRRDEAKIDRILKSMSNISDEELKAIHLVLIQHLAKADVEWAHDKPDIWWGKLSSKFSKDEASAAAIMKQVSRITKEINPAVNLATSKSKDDLGFTLADICEKVANSLGEEFTVLTADWEVDYGIQAPLLQRAMGGMGGMGGGGMGGMSSGGMF